VLVSNKVNIWREIVEAGAGFAAEDDLKGTVELLTQWENLTSQQRSAMRGTARSCFMDCFEVHRTAQELLEIMQESAVGEITTPANTKGEIRDGY
jgi:glycosyltransferase involved in cell wall biosynthesis